MRRWGWRSTLAGLLALVGFASVGEAGWIHTKAQLGQLLITRAWHRALGGEPAPRPWPWADTRPVARLEVPAHGADVFVLEGGTGSTLAWGPGHLAGTPPVGSPGNSVVAGHRDTHFGFLGDLAVGDALWVRDVEGRSHLYRVARRFVTDERNTGVLAPLPPGDTTRRLTLVTCFPFETPIPGGGLRFVVVADAVEPGVDG